MTTLAPAPERPGPAPATATVLARVCRAEWTRIWTVRSSWWFTLATAITVIGIATILGFDVRGDPPSQQPDGTAWLGGRISATFGLFGVLTLALVGATADHGTGGIVPALQWTPRRGVLLAARTTVVVATATMVGVVLVAVGSAVVYGLAPEMGLPASEGARVLGEVTFVYAAASLLAVGLGLATRSTAGGLSGVVALMLVLPLMLAILPFEWARQLAELLPGAGAMFLLTTEGVVEGVTIGSARTTLAMWAVGLAVVGGLRLTWTDADR